MYQSLDIFQTSGAMARHAGARQALTAANMANADTPGYVGRSLPSFQDSYRMSQTGVLRATRPAHFGVGPDGLVQPSETRAEPAPNGNAVSVELEMLRSVEAQREHSRALAIYRHGMTVMRAVIGA